MEDGAQAGSQGTRERRVLRKAGVQFGEGYVSRLCRACEVESWAVCEVTGHCDQGKQ